MVFHGSLRVQWLPCGIFRWFNHANITVMSDIGLVSDSARDSLTSTLQQSQLGAIDSIVDFPVKFQSG